MAYDVSALSNYTEENADMLIFQTVTDSVTAKLMVLQSGIKSADKINIVSLDAHWQTDACSFNPSGSTAFSQRTLTVGKIMENLDWCEKDLETKYTQKKLAAGSTYENLTYEKEFVAKLQNQTSHKVENAIWNGDTNSVDVNLNKFDGLRKIIGAAAGVIASAQSGGTAWSEANSRVVSKGLGVALASNDSTLPMLSDPETVAFIGDAELLNLRHKYMADNLYNQNLNGEGQLMVEGTQIPFVAVPGLSGKKEIYVMRKSNMYLGTDLAHEEEKFVIFYNTNSRKIEYEKHFKLGVQIAFPNEVVKYISA